MTNEMKNKVQNLVNRYESFQPKCGPLGNSGLADITNRLKKDTIKILQELLKNNGN